MSLSFLYYRNIEHKKCRYLLLGLATDVLGMA